MARPFPCIVLAACVATSAATLFAQPSPPPGSLNTWVDACQATAPDLQAMLANEALIVDEDFLPGNGDGTFELLHQPFLVGTNGAGLPEYPMCSHARFYGETRVQVPGFFRSAVQVGPDLVLTALHGAATSGIDRLRVVFGVHGRLVGTTCVPPDFSRIPASDIYTVSLVADGWPNNELDYLLLRLDRQRVNAYPRVRRSGRAYPGDAMTGIGHPERLPGKVDTAGVAGEITMLSGREWLEMANVHGLVGSSGSMVYNRTQRILEAVARTGLGTSIVLDPGADTEPPCNIITHMDAWKSKNASLRYFAQNIPPYELLVDPLDWVVLKAAAGTPIAHSSNRTLKAPSSGPIQYQIVPPALTPAGQPTLTISAGGPLQGTLQPGQVLTVQQTAAASASVPCKVYERTYLVRDLTHGFEDVARHVFEIGKRGFSVTGGRDGFDDLATPFEESFSYTVTNTQPSPFTLRVSSDQPWVSINGAPGPFELAFQPNDVKQVAIGVLEAYWTLPHPETYLAQLTFEVAPNGTHCPASPPVIRTFAFSYGTDTFKSNLQPPPQIPPTQISVTQWVDEDACIGDLNVSIATDGVDASELMLWLKAPPPSDLERVIWNPGDAPDPHEFEIDEGALNDFEGLGTHGTWTLKAVDAVPATPSGKLNSWSLRFESCSFP